MYDVNVHVLTTAISQHCSFPVLQLQYASVFLGQYHLSSLVLIIFIWLNDFSTVIYFCKFSFPPKQKIMYETLVHVQYIVCTLYLIFVHVCMVFIVFCSCMLFCTHVLYMYKQIKSLETDLSSVKRLAAQFEQEVAEASQEHDLQLLDSQVHCACTCNY